MSDIKLFSLRSGAAEELPGEAVVLEKSLQTLIERRLQSLLGVRFLASELPTGARHGGRIDTLGLDENGCPVIIEFKRATNENVINQGLLYLDWLLDHRAKFKLLVIERLGVQHAEGIDWSAPRLLCVAGGYTRYDEHAVNQMNRNIELIRYRRFGEELLLLELFNATSADGVNEEGSAPGGSATYRNISQTIAQTQGPPRDLLEELRAYLPALGDHVQVETLKYYLAFKCIKDFACVELHPAKGCISAFVKVLPATVTIQAGFTRDMSDTGHYGTGDLEITLRSRAVLERAKPLFQQSYEAS